MRPSLAVRLCALLTILACTFRAVRAQDGTNQPGTDVVSDNPIQAVPGLAVLLQTKDDRRQFHFGEMIEVKLLYVAPQSGRYVRVNLNKLKGGHAWQWRCEPASRTINRRTNDGRISAQPFYYAGEHCREGIGGGIAGGCGDCGGENPLGSVPLSYEILLNNELQFLQPSRYTCRVATADVATPASPGPDEERTAIELVSNPIVMDVNEDPTWSADTLDAARLQFGTAHCLGLPDESSRCWDPVNKIRFLDTEDSLTQLVRLYKGENKTYWQELLWLGILQSQHSKLARKLLEKRMVDPDFTVTTGFLDTLTAITLREDYPEAFNQPVLPDEASIYHRPSLEILRNYLRTIAKALPKKRTETLSGSLETYTRYAGQSFCADEPLIPPAEMQERVAATKQRQP